MNKRRIAAILAVLPIVGYTISALSFLVVFLSGFDLHTVIIHRISDLALLIPAKLAIPFLAADIIAFLILKKNGPEEKSHRAIKIAAGAGLLLSTAILIGIGFFLLTGPSIHDLPNQ